MFYNACIATPSEYKTILDAHFILWFPPMSLCFLRFCSSSVSTSSSGIALLPYCVHLCCVSFHLLIYTMLCLSLFCFFVAHCSKSISVLQVPYSYLFHAFNHHLYSGYGNVFYSCLCYKHSFFFIIIIIISRVKYTPRTNTCPASLTSVLLQHFKIWLKVTTEKFTCWLRHMSI